MKGVLAHAAMSLFFYPGNPYFDVTVNLAGEHIVTLPNGEYDSETGARKQWNAKIGWGGYGKGRNTLPIVLNYLIDTNVKTYAFMIYCFKFNFKFHRLVGHSFLDMEPTEHLLDKLEQMSKKNEREYTRESIREKDKQLRCQILGEMTEIIRIYAKDAGLGVDKKDAQMLALLEHDNHLFNDIIPLWGENKFISYLPNMIEILKHMKELCLGLTLEDSVKKIEQVLEETCSWAKREELDVDGSADNVKRKVAGYVNERFQTSILRDEISIKYGKALGFQLQSSLK